MTEQTPREALERKVADVITEHVEIGYELRPDGLVDPNTIRVAGALGAAHMAVHTVMIANGGRLTLAVGENVRPEEVKP